MDAGAARRRQGFLDNLHRYDHYDRKATKVYVGEYASRGNSWSNALAEAAYMTGLERNGAVVRLASYAPLLANQKHTQWRPDLIYFDNTRILRSANYHVQQMFMQNSATVICRPKWVQRKQISRSRARERERRRDLEAC